MSNPRKNAIRPLIEAPPVQDDSADYICAVVSVPNTESYKAILVGVLEVAAKWINYMPSGTDREAVVARIWGEIIDNMVFDICQCVADCIANDVATQTAIANAIASNQSIQNSIQQASQNSSNNGSGYYNSVVNYLGDNQIPNDALCTDANKYAMALATVRALDKMTTDMLEIIEFLTDANEIAAELIGAIPLFGGAASSALDTANWLQDHIQTAYNAAYNATTERDYACSIYCNFQDCVLSYEDIIVAYEQQGVIAPPTNTDWFTVLNWLITNIVPASQNTVVGAMHYLILIMLEYGSTWFGSGVWSYIQMEIENAKDEEITVPAECACAPSGWAYYQDFKVGVGDWTLIGGTTQQNGVGLVSYAASGQQNCLVLLDLPTSYNWQYAQIKYSRTGGVHGVDSYRVIFWTQYPQSSGRVNHITTASEGDGNFDKCYDSSAFNIDRNQISFFIEGNEAGQVIIESIKVWATDSDTPPSPLIDNAPIGCL